MKNYQSRSEVPEKYKFDLTDFYSSLEEAKQTLKKLEAKIEQEKEWEEKEIDAFSLETYLIQRTDLEQEIENLYAYAYLSHDVDLENQEILEFLELVWNVNTKMEANNAFFEPWIISLKEETFEKLFQQNKNLLSYEQLLRKIYKEKEHRLSKEEERLITILTENFNSYHTLSQTLINQEHDYGSIKLQQEKWNIIPSNVRFLKQQKEEKVRKAVHQKFGKKLKQYQKTESAYLYYYIKNRLNLSKIRHFQNTWEEKRYHIELPNELFKNLVSSAKEHIDSYQNYYRLIKKVLHQKTLHSYDTLQNWSTMNQKYSIEEAAEIIQKALEPLGDNYQAKLKKVFEKRYIDYCSYKGKVNGGYSLSTSTHPSRIVMSYTESMTDILTIAHEIGHNIHHQYTQENNPSWYQNISMYVAEIASLTNEFLVNDYFKKHGKTQEEKKSGIEHTIKTFQNNFFGAIMEGEMEEKMYEHIENGNTITADFLNQLAKKQLKDYQGNTIKQDEYSSYMWVTRSHYYLDFYLYSYAICISIAANIAKRIIEKEPNIIQKYEEFLSSGSDITPVSAYQKLGIDIQKKEVFENAISFFQEQLNAYENLLNKEGGTNE